MEINEKDFFPAGSRTSCKIKIKTRSSNKAGNFTLRSVVQCRWGHRGVASSPEWVHGGALVGVQWVKPFKKFGIFYIWRTNKQLKIEES